MMISLISTVKNEEKSVADLLNSIVNQSRKPDEIIIVDGGSTDKTVDIIKSFKNRLPIKIIVAPGANLARGRNIAVQHAKGKIIASVDGGCILDPNWLKNITKPFFLDSTIDVVAGYYKPCNLDGLLGKTISNFFSQRKEKIKEMPSSRSIAFRKEVWEKVGGYPEHLTRTGEDTLFNIRLKKSGCKFHLAADAVVYWKQPSKLAEAFWKIYNYSKGDGEALIRQEKHALLALIYFTGIGIFVLGIIKNPAWLMVLFLLFIGYVIVRCLYKIEKLSLSLFLTSIPVIVTLDIGTLFGYLKGMRARGGGKHYERFVL